MTVAQPAQAFETDTPDPAVVSLYANLDHCTRLSEKIRMLQAAQVDADAALTASVARAYEEGRIDVNELAEIAQRYRPYVQPGFSGRWDRSVAIKWYDAVVLSLPNLDKTTWHGRGRPGRRDPAPGNGVSVVYVLFDATNTPVYVGSTAQFRIRLARHFSNGKPVVYWRAHRCENRRAAFALEDRLLKQYTPLLNKRAGR